MMSIHEAREGLQERKMGRNSHLLQSACSLLDVGAIRRGRKVNAAIELGRVEGNELDGNGCRLDRAFVADDVGVSVTGIDERGGRLSCNESVDVRCAVVFILGDAA